MAARSESSRWTLPVHMKLSRGWKSFPDYLDWRVEASAELCPCLGLSCCIIDGGSCATDATYHELRKVQEYHAGCGMIGGIKIGNAAFAEIHCPVCTLCLT